MNKNVTLKQLRAFLAVARTGHFGRAAENCAVTQPALSNQIKELEQNLDAKLFERTTRKIELTPIGQRLQKRAQDILEASDELTQIARAQDGEFKGPLRLGVIPTIAPYLMPKFILKLNALPDQTDLQLREAFTSKLIEELTQGQLDAAIIALPFGDVRLEEYPLFDEAFVLVRPLECAGKALPTPDARAEMPFLMLEEGHCFRDQALGFCASISTRPPITHDGSSLTTLTQLVAAGVGMTLIPQMAVELETRAGQVAIDHYIKDAPSRQVGMVWRKNNPLDTHLRRIAELLKDA